MREPAESRVVAIDGPPWPRRLFHAAAGSAIPLLALLVPDPAPVVLVGILAIVSLVLDLIRLRVPWLNRFFLYWLSLLLKKEEAARITGATYLLIAACLCFLLFDTPIAVAVLLFLSLGDPAAALIGRPIPGPRVFGKSPVGTLAFFCASFLVVAVLVATGITEFGWILIGAAVIAGLVELAPFPLDDNLTVPLISGAAAQYLPFVFAALTS